MRNLLTVHSTRAAGAAAAADLSGGTEGTVAMWQFHQMRQPLQIYRASDNSRVTALRFSQFGVKFGVGDSAGNLGLFNFEARPESTTPYQVRRRPPCRSICLRRGNAGLTHEDRVYSRTGEPLPSDAQGALDHGP